MMRFFFLACVSGFELKLDTWDEAVKGKTVFIKFLAHWCPNCKKMKGDWDKLMYAYEHSPTALVSSVVCSMSGASLCEKHNITKYPTIKYGSPDDLKLYEGGRDFKSLRAFAHDVLHLSCSPDHPHACDDPDDRAQMEAWKKMSMAEFQKEMQKANAAMQAVEDEYQEKS